MAYSSLGKSNFSKMYLLLELLWLHVLTIVIFKINMRTKRHFSVIMFCRAELVVLYNLLGLHLLLMFFSTQMLQPLKKCKIS